MTVSREITGRMHVAEAGESIVAEKQGRIVPAAALSIPADQAWFWTPEWQAMVTQAEADRLAGRSTRYASEQEFMVALGETRVVREIIGAQLEIHDFNS